MRILFSECGKWKTLKHTRAMKQFALTIVQIEQIMLCLAFSTPKINRTERNGRYWLMNHSVILRNNNRFTIHHIRYEMYDAHTTYHVSINQPAFPFSLYMNFIRCDDDDA